MSCATACNAPDRTCQIVDYGSGCCNLPTGDICQLSRIKGNLKPTKITASTAKFRITVPRQSQLESPYANGWTMTVTRAGVGNVIAEYPIAEYDTSRSQAVFFIDDTTRMAKKGYYIATVKKDCCVVARILMHLDCDRATDYEVTNFTHDPCPPSVCDLRPRAAECEPTCCATETILDPCGTCDYQANTGCEIASVISLDELAELNESCKLC